MIHAAVVVNLIPPQGGSHVKNNYLSTILVVTFLTRPCFTSNDMYNTCMCSGGCNYLSTILLVVTFLTRSCFTSNDMYNTCMCSGGCNYLSTILLVVTFLTRPCFTSNDMYNTCMCSGGCIQCHSINYKNQKTF